MGEHLSGLMKTHFQPLLIALVMMTASLSGCILAGDDDSEVSVTAVFSYSPQSNIRTGDSVQLDGSSSLPSDGSLTYSWDCDGDGSADKTGQKVSCSWEVEGTYSVTLTVVSGSKSNSQTKDITVSEAPVGSPTAEITQYTDEEDCEYDEIDNTRDIMLWICAMDKDPGSDREIQDVRDVQLSASDSESGGAEQYISEYSWDLDLEVDSDGDGNTENDADLTGENAEWKDVAPGEYQINLSVTNNVGGMDGDKIKVYVSFYGHWSDSDWQISGANSNDPEELEFEMPVFYDKEQGNTIRKVEVILSYPQIDDDCTDITPGEGNNCRNKLDIYAYNEDEDEAKNTTETPLDNREEGDCDDESDCVLMLLSSYMFTDTESTYGDGEWIIAIHNEKVNDQKIESFVIILHYK